MKLSAKQSMFLDDVSVMIHWHRNTYPNQYLTYGETYRPPETAKIYAERGIGIVNSLHCQRLAIDLHLFIKGKYQTNPKKYKPLGEFWKALDLQNRWGGDFFNEEGIPDPDGVHFERQT